MLDFYLIVSDYRDAYRAGLAGASPTALIPPNVFPFEHDGPGRQICGAERGGFRAAERARGGRRLGLGAVRPAVAAGLGERTRRRGTRRSTRWREAAPTLLALCAADGGGARRSARRLAARLRAHLCARAAGRAARAAGLDRRCRSGALPALRRGGARRSPRRPRRCRRGAALAALSSAARARR